MYFKRNYEVIAHIDICATDLKVERFEGRFKLEFHTIFAGFTILQLVKKCIL